MISGATGLHNPWHKVTVDETVISKEGYLLHITIYGSMSRKKTICSMHFPNFP
jgi:hypothetical protein